MNISTYDILKTAAKQWPDRPAIVEGEQTLSYRQLLEQTEILREELETLGIAHGMGLGVMGRNSISFVMAMFAGMACGATVLPISHQLKSAEINQLVKDTKLHAILDDESGVRPIQGEPACTGFLRQPLRFFWTGVSFNHFITPLPDAALIRYTSGTTGDSKGVVLTHRSISERVEVTQAALKLTENDAVLWVLPMAFHFIVTILVYIRSGAKIILCKDLLADTIIHDANQHQATLLYASPMHFRLLAADQSENKMESLKMAISTSSGIPVAITDAFQKRFGLSVTQAYGIIEIGLPLIDSLSGDSSSETVGYPIKGISVAILDDDNQQLGKGESGYLAIKGAGMFDAYLKPWKTADKIMNDDWFMTGDLAQYQKDGRVIICGREKTMINVSGNKAFPEEIEDVLNKHHDILSSRVFGEMHPLMGEIVCAEVIMKEEISLDVEEVLTFCRTQLSTYKVPQRLQQVSEILHTHSGKIKRVK